MTVHMFCEKIQAKILTGQSELDRTITGCYIGDLLSWVMSRAKKGDVWLTVMGNINAIAVASLVDVSCIVLTDNAPLDDAAYGKAQELKIPVLSVSDSSYEIAKKVAELSE